MSQQSAAAAPGVKTGQFLVFAIDAGRIQWYSAHDTRQEAVDHLNALRPDGTSSAEGELDASKGEVSPVNEAFTTNDCIEFAFIVESPHFVAFV